MLSEKNEKNNLLKDRKWKEKNKDYLRELQNFLDKVELIQEEQTKHMIINQMLKCDNILTEICEQRFMQIYEEGFKKRKKSINLVKVVHNINCDGYVKKSYNRNNSRNYLWLL